MTHCIDGFYFKDHAAVQYIPPYLDCVENNHFANPTRHFRFLAMSDFSVLQCLGYAERSSPYGQLFRDIYQCTGPKELRKLEPLIERTYLQHVSAEVEESSWLDLSAQWGLDRDPARLDWLDSLLRFMERRGTPITASPSVPQQSKRPLDLHLLFNLTMIEAGGMRLCTESDGWRNIARHMDLPVEKAHVLPRLYKKFLLPFEEHQKNQVIRPQGQGNNNSAARSQISSSKAEKRRTEVEGENVTWKERVKVRDLRTHLNNNRWSVFTRLGGAGHNNNRKKWRSRNRKN